MLEINPPRNNRLKLIATMRVGGGCMSRFQPQSHIRAIDFQCLEKLKLGMASGRMQWD